MRCDWQKFSVADLLAHNVLYIGDGYRAKLEELGSAGLPFARAGNIDSGFHFEDADRFPTEDLSRVGQKVSQPGDVVFTSKGTVGRFALVRQDTPPFVYSPQLCFWRVLQADRINPRFLFYWMSGREFYDQYKGVAGQTDMAEYVSLADQRRMYITLPPLSEQGGIAEVLGALDDKIELNRRVNETLEAMARAIFKSWFVDFDPVRAKAEGRQPSGMDAATAAHFPKSFEESRLGKIPRGWTVAPLPEIARINPPRLLEKGRATTYLDMQNMPTRGHRAAGWIQRPFVSGSRFTNGDTLIARITPCLENGKTAYVDFLKDGEVAWGSTEFIVLRPKDPLPSEYGYCLARDEEFRAHAIQNMTGSSGRQRVPTDCFSQYL